MVRTVGRKHGEIEFFAVNPDYEHLAGATH
jgi:hypothetical protein